MLASSFRNTILIISHLKYAKQELLRSEGLSFEVIASVLSDKTSQSLLFSHKQETQIKAIDGNPNGKILDKIAELKRLIPEETRNHSNLEGILEQFYGKMLNNAEMAEIVFHDNNTYPYYSDDEKNNEFMDIESSNTTNSPERNDSQEGYISTSATTQQASEIKKNIKLNQGDAVKIICTQFNAFCDQMNQRNSLQIPKFPSFHCYQSIESIIQMEENKDFLKTLVSFLEGEIKNYLNNNQGLFKHLETRGYMHSKIYRILQTLNDLIRLNNQDPKKESISNYLHLDFLNFHDGSLRKNKKTKYSNQLQEDFGGMEIEEEKYVNRSKSDSICKNLPASNQNDALKLLSTKLQNYWKENYPSEIRPPKFKFYKDIEEKILKSKDFSFYIKLIVRFINFEIDKVSKNSNGLFSDLKNKGYFDNTVHRIMRMLEDLVYINNHIDRCDRCHDFFEKPWSYLIISDWTVLGFVQTKKGPKTVFSDWVTQIKDNDCHGFDSAKETTFKLAKSSRGIRRR